MFFFENFTENDGKSMEIARKFNMERACIAAGTMFFDLKSFGDDLMTCNNHFLNHFATEMMISKHFSKFEFSVVRPRRETFKRRSRGRC